MSKIVHRSHALIVTNMSMLCHFHWSFLFMYMWYAYDFQRWSLLRNSEWIYPLSSVESDCLIWTDVCLLQIFKQATFDFWASQTETFLSIAASVSYCFLLFKGWVRILLYWSWLFRRSSRSKILYNWSCKCIQESIILHRKLMY